MSLIWKKKRGFDSEIVMLLGQWLHYIDVLRSPPQDHHSDTIFLYINTREFSLLVILISHRIEVKLPNIASLSLNSLM